jgi:hypothetical protein
VPYNESPLLFPSLSCFEVGPDGKPLNDFDSDWYTSLKLGWDKRRRYTFVVWSLRILENVNLFLFAYNYDLANGTLTELNTPTQS